MSRETIRSKKPPTKFELVEAYLFPSSTPKHSLYVGLLYKKIK